MKCNQTRPGFELVSPCPFPTTITITPRTSCSELWVTYCHYLWFLGRFHQFFLHTILNIHSDDFITKFRVFEQVEVTCIEAAEVQATLDRTRLSDGESSPAQDHNVWWTLYWPLPRRCTKEAVQEQFEKPLVPVTSTITNGQPKLSTMTPGISPSIMLSLLQGYP